MTEAPSQNQASGRAEWMRGALTGSLVGAVAGVAWGLWGASGLGGAAAVLAGATTIVTGVVLIVANRRADRALAAITGGSQAPPTRFSRGYWLIVAAEVVAIAAGSAVAGATGHDAARAPWICTVVGVHFFFLGRLWAARPILVLAAALTALGLVMLVVAFAGGRFGAVTAVTGLLAAVVFFSSAAFAVGSATAVARAGQ